MYHVFTIATDGTVTKEEQKKAPDLAQLQKAVGGYIETIPYVTTFEHDGITYKRGTACANEEGLLKGHAENPIATKLYRDALVKHCGMTLGQCAFYGIVGPAVFYATVPKGR